MSSTTIQKQEIASILELIVEQSETILSYPDGQIPQIELDIARENIRKLYNNFSILDKINSRIIDRVTQRVVDEMMPHPTTAKDIYASVVENAIPDEKPSDVKEVRCEEPENEMVEPVKSNEISVAETAAVETAEHFAGEPIKVDVIPVEKVAESAAEPVMPKVAEPEHLAIVDAPIDTPAPIEKVKPHPVAKPIETSVASEMKSTPVVERASKHAKEPKLTTGTLFDDPTPSIADMYKDHKPALYEKMASKTDNSLATKLQQKPISDLTKSIGLNDRFLLIKELFYNNGEEYHEAIQFLNNFSTLMQAFEYLDVLKQKYDWDESSDASLKLYDLIRRKYQQ